MFDMSIMARHLLEPGGSGLLGERNADLG